MITKQEFLKILKKYHNKFFTTKQAINDFILEHYDVAYVDLKFKSARLQPLVRETKNKIHTLLRDMEKTGMIQKYRGYTWSFNHAL